MRGPVQPQERDRVRELHAAGVSRNEIARELGRGVATVTRIANALGLKFDREQTKAATAAAVADNKAIRAATSRRLLDEANSALDRLHEPCLVYSFGGRDNTYREHLLDRPASGELRNIMTSAAIALDKHTVLERLDVDTGTENARSVLGQLGEALMVAAERIDGEVAE